MAPYRTCNSMEEIVQVAIVVEKNMISVDLVYGRSVLNVSAGAGRPVPLYRL